MTIAFPGSNSLIIFCPTLKAVLNCWSFEQQQQPHHLYNNAGLMPWVRLVRKNHHAPAYLHHVSSIPSFRSFFRILKMSSFSEIRDGTFCLFNPSFLNLCTFFLLHHQEMPDFFHDNYCVGIFFGMLP